MGRHGAEPFFFRGRDDGTFRRITYNFVDPAGYDPVDGDEWVDRHNCAWGEATGDGPPELYCSVGSNVGKGVGPNQLLTWTTEGIRDLAKRYGVRDIYGRGRSVNWLDYDTDGDLDLYVGNWAREGHPSALFRNRRSGFRRARAGVADQLRTISSSWADWDRDGDPDLLVMQFAAPTVAYENRRGKFVRVSLTGVTGGHWYSAAWGDYNGDGFSDLHVIGETEAVVFKNVRGRFRAVDTTRVRDGRMSVWLDLDNDTDLELFVVQGAPGVTPDRDAMNEADFLLVRRGDQFVKLISKSMRGRRHGSGDTATAADFDRDGRMDLFVTNGYFEYEQWKGRSSLLRNSNEARGWVALDLDGGRWNPLGIGARLHVRTALFEYWREITDGVTFRGQSEVSHVLLGIGRAPWAKVWIRWTDGTRDCVSVDQGSTVSVSKGRNPC